MIRNRADQLGKNILNDALRPYGVAQTEAEVPPGDAQRIDLWFVPDKTRVQVGPHLQGIFASLAAAPAAIELWSGGIDERAMHACLRKRYAWHHALEGRDKQDWTMPPLWGLCAGRPDGVLAGFGFEPAPEGPLGHYRTVAPLWRVRLVVLSELPRTRETILLRLLGRAQTRRQAMAELRALPVDAFERKVADPWLSRLRYEVRTPNMDTLSQEDKELEMDVLEWAEARDRELQERSMEQGSLKTLAHMFERRLRRALTDAERTALERRIRAEGADHVSDIVLDLSPTDLAAWLGATNGH